MRLFVILALLCALGLSFSSVVNFTTPTNGTIFSNATSYVFNATATQLEASPMSVLNWSWNGSSYVFYNGSLLAMYDFDNVSSLGENDSLVVDSSLNSNNVSCSNCSLWSSSGKYGGAFTFDGVDDYFNGSRSTSLEVQTLSIESWIYIDSSPGIRSAIATYGYGTTAGGPIDGSAESYSLSYQNDISSFRFRLKDAVGANFIDLYSSSSTPLAEIQNQWVHVVATWDGTNAKIYKNGQLHLSATNAGTINYFADPESKLRIGNWFGNNERWFKGKIDSVRIYGRSFNSSEVLEHYYSDLSKFNTTSWIFYSNHSTSNEGQNTYGMCMLDSSNDLNCTLTKNLTIDRTAPSISLLSPTDDHALTPSFASASFLFNATDALSSNLSCSFIFGGSSISSNSSVFNSSITTFSHTVTSSASWYISCSDLAGNNANSSTYSIRFSPQPSSSQSSSSSRIRSSIDSSCNQNTLTTNPSDVDVEISDDSNGEVIFEGSTDSSGKFTFEGCGKTIRYSLSKSGYRSTHGVENLDSCSCLSESVDDSQTSSTENSVVSSDLISDSTPSSTSEVVALNSTPSPSLVAPLSASVGDSVTIRSESCRGCTLVVDDPSGIVLRIELGDSQTTTISIGKEGNYQFSLLKDGEIIARSSLVSSSIPSLAVPSPQKESNSTPPQKIPTTPNSNSWLLPFIVVLIVVVGSVVYLFVLKKKK